MIRQFTALPPFHLGEESPAPPDLDLALEQLWARCSTARESAPKDLDLVLEPKLGEGSTWRLDLESPRSLRDR